MEIQPLWSQLGSTSQTGRPSLGQAKLTAWNHVCCTRPTTPTASSEPPNGACPQLPASLQAPNPSQVTNSHFGSRVQGGQETIAFHLWGIPAHRAVWRQGAGLNGRTPWVSGHSPSWILGISAWRQQGSETPPGSLADPYHRHRVRRDNKRNIQRCGRLLGSLQQAEQHCQGTSCASSIWAFFPCKIKKESSPRRQKGKDSGPGTALPFILACNPHYRLVPASHFV